MCGIVGIAALSGQRPVARGVVRRMAAAIVHRGPDAEGFFECPGLALGSRRLSVVGLADGRQPMYNEDRSVAVVYNGELFDYPQRRAQLEGRGHRLVTRCDTELIPHLWEDHAENMFERLRGQFALALWDAGRGLLILARDRFGICPLYWTRQTRPDGDWLLFASEIKALLASGMVEAAADVRGIDQAFNFFAVPGPHTCFKGVRLLQPGSYLKVRLQPASGRTRLDERIYWRISFPDQGQERRDDRATLVGEFEDVLMSAVERRLRADVPVVSYLSGGIDSGIVAALAARLRGQALPAFTVQITTPHLDETPQAAALCRRLGAESIVVRCGDDEILRHYPQLIRAAEAPVVDTSCVGLLLLAAAVHERGYKVALTGEGSDEWLGGYAWFKVHKLLGVFDAAPGLALSGAVRRWVLMLMGAPKGAARRMRQIASSLGHHGPYQDIYGVMGLARLRFYSPDMLERLADYNPYLALEPDLARINQWHPMNRALYWGGRIHLPGQLLSLKGDRVAMNSSVEMRYPFLDEKVFEFLAGVHPRWKLRGFRDKYLLRLVGERHLPRQAAWARKGMFRAPLHSLFGRGAAGYIDQLLSDESLVRTGYFDPHAVGAWRAAHARGRLSWRSRSAVELGLAAVAATQLWHHLHIDASLAELPREPSGASPAAAPAPAGAH